MKFYAMIDGQQKGPFELEELPEAGVRPSTYVWTKGMDDWQKAEDNADICRFFRNHLYNVMHPSVPPAVPQPEADDKYKIRPDTNPTGRSRFDAYLKEWGEALPTLEEIDARQDKETPPISMVGYAWAVTLLCCLPTGIVALVYAYKSKAAWKNNEKIKAHDYCRSAKLWTGVSFFIGLILYALFFGLNL